MSRNTNSRRRTEIHPGTGLSKREQYGWREQKDRGVIMELGKHLLQVDKTYQRQESDPRVRHIASQFSWPAFGVILVSKREDGRYYVFDGQHRVLATRLRDDVENLPCLVFEFDELSEEARAFIDANTVRGAMSALEKYNGRIQSKDSDVLMIQSILADHGYVVPKNKSTRSPGCIFCVQAIERIYNRGASHLRRVLECAGTVNEDAPPTSVLLGALSYLDSHLQRKHKCNLGTRSDIVDKMSRLGPTKIDRAMRNMQAITGRSGEKIHASGLVSEINKGKRTRRIMPIIDG